jgi:hypothetical protein
MYTETCPNAGAAKAVAAKTLLSNHFVFMTLLLAVLPRLRRRPVCLPEAVAALRLHQEKNSGHRAQTSFRGMAGEPFARLHEDIKQLNRQTLCKILQRKACESLKSKEKDRLRVQAALRKLQ